MYSQTTAAQKPETFQMSNEAQQSLPPDVQRGLHEVDRLKYFLISAPVDLKPNTLINTHALPTGDIVSCVYWNGLFHISGTDIVRCLSFRFQAFGRPVKNTKKFEEGIFSDLRNLKSGTDATLEEPKSPFLDFLYKNNCIRTQKKQKVFYWYHVPHDRLFLDALERDLKREKMGQEPTTVAISEPALSFEFDASISLFEQLTKAQQQASSTAAGLAIAANPNATVVNGSASSVSSSAYNLPIMPSAESMPPPPPQIHHPAVTPVPQMITDDMYNPVGMPLSVMNNPMVKVEQHGMPSTPYERSYDKRNVSLSRLATRHASMPAYVEYSPAPSFVSSQFDDYGVAASGGHPASRGMSFEPVTPPHNSSHQIPAMAPPSGADTGAYIGNEDGIFSTIPDMSTPTTSSANPATYDSLMPMSSSHLPAIGSSFPSTGQVSGDVRSFSDPHSMYPIVEGSPRFERKDNQQVRSVSDNVMAGPQIMPSMQHHATSGDISRAVSMTPVPESAMMSMDTSPSGTHIISHQNSPALAATGLSGSRLHQRDVYQDFSRHETPLSTFEEEPASQQRMGTPGSFASSTMTSDFSPHPRLNLGSRVQTPRRPNLIGPVRRARSATVLDVDPYSHPGMHSQHPDATPHAGVQYYPSHLSSVPPLQPPQLHATTTPSLMGPSSVNRAPGQKALTCPQPGCGRVCKRLEHLKRHYRTHTDDRPYECSHCGKRFSRSDNLGQHKRTHERHATQGSVGSRRGKIHDGNSPPHMLSRKEEHDILETSENENPGSSTAGRSSIMGYNISTSASTSPASTIALGGVTTPAIAYETHYQNHNATPTVLHHHQTLRQHSETPLSHPPANHVQEIALSDS